MAYIRSGTGGGAETPTLLWTNPSPTSAFAAQTLNIDTSQYEYIYIKFYATQWDDTVNEAIFPTNISYPQVIGGHYSSASFSSTQIYVRKFIISSNQISFQDGYNVVPTSSASKTNTLCVPLEIKGYKTI